MGNIAVIGATGNIGSRIVAQLAGRGHTVRAISRNPHDAGAGIEPFVADLTDRDQAVHALEGIDVAYLTPPMAGNEPLEGERLVTSNVIDAAAKQSVGHLVMHTAVQADRGNTGAGILDNKTSAEQALAESGVPFTVLRPAWFMQNLWAARDHIDQGVVSMPWDGDLAWAATDINDIVRLAVGFLEGTPANRGFDVHVEGGITGAQIAAAATEVLGRPVSYQEAPVPTRDFVEGFPIADAHKDLYAELFDHFKAAPYLGEPTAISQAVPGFTPRTVTDFLRDELFAAG